MNNNGNNENQSKTDKQPVCQEGHADPPIRYIKNGANVANETRIDNRSSSTRKS